MNATCPVALYVFVLVLRKARVYSPEPRILRVALFLSLPRSARTSSVIPQFREPCVSVHSVGNKKKVCTIISSSLRLGY